MALPKGEKKHKLMAFLLHSEFNYTQASISQLMQIAPSTASTWIAFGRLLSQNLSLKKEVEQLRTELTQIGYVPLKNLDGNIIKIVNN